MTLDAIFDNDAICLVRLFILYATPSIFFLHFFLTYLLPYLSFPLRIDPFHSQAGYHKRRLNVASVFCVHFVLSYISFDWWMCAFVVFGLVFPYQAKRLASGNVFEMIHFVSSGDVKPQLSQPQFVVCSWMRSRRGTWMQRGWVQVQRVKRMHLTTLDLWSRPWLLRWFWRTWLSYVAPPFLRSSLCLTKMHQYNIFFMSYRLL